MPDLATISAFIGSIKTATEIAKAIKGADLSLEKAEFKLKLAELIEALAEAKMQATEVQDIIREKDDKIKELQKLLENKSKLIRHSGKHFEVDEEGKPIGEPYCSNCWESKDKMIHLNNFDEIFICPSCDSKVLDF